MLERESSMISKFCKVFGAKKSCEIQNRPTLGVLIWGPIIVSYQLYIKLISIIYLNDMMVFSPSKPYPRPLPILVNSS